MIVRSINICKLLNNSDREVGKNRKDFLFFSTNPTAFFLAFQKKKKKKIGEQSTKTSEINLTKQTI